MPEFITTVKFWEHPGYEIVIERNTSRIYVAVVYCYDMLEWIIRATSIYEVLQQARKRIEQ